jgi:hypothetical protein
MSLDSPSNPDNRRQCHYYAPSARLSGFIGLPVNTGGVRGQSPQFVVVAMCLPSLGPIQGEVQASPRDTNFGGRLLLYTPSENLACGAAEVSSNGFFDVNNVPPWDIWVGFSERTLVSWVPPALIEVAQMGIYVNPEECIRWAN